MTADRESRAWQLWDTYDSFRDGLTKGETLGILGWSDSQLACAKADIRDALQILKEAPLITVWDMEKGDYVTKLASAWSGADQARAYARLRVKTLLSQTRTLEKTLEACTFLPDVSGSTLRIHLKPVKRLREDLEEQFETLD